MRPKKRKGWGGARKGAGRPRKTPARNQAVELLASIAPIARIDPEAILHLVAGDALQPASARVAACKMLLVLGRGRVKIEAAADGANALDRKTMEILSRSVN